MININSILGNIFKETSLKSTNFEKLIISRIDLEKRILRKKTDLGTDIGINLDVNAAGLGTTTTTGMDIDVVGSTDGTHTAVGLDVAVGSADVNYAAKFTGGTILIQEQADAVTDVTGYGQLWVNTATPNELYFTDDAGEDFNLGSRLSATGKSIAMAIVFG